MYESEGQSTSLGKLNFESLHICDHKNHPHRLQADHRGSARFVCFSIFILRGQRELYIGFSLPILRNFFLFVCVYAVRNKAMIFFALPRGEMVYLMVDVSGNPHTWHPFHPSTCSLRCSGLSVTCAKLPAYGFFQLYASFSPFVFVWPHSFLWSSSEGRQLPNLHSDMYMYVCDCVLFFSGFPFPVKVCLSAGPCWRDLIGQIAHVSIKFSRRNKHHRIHIDILYRI